MGQKGFQKEEKVELLKIALTQIRFQAPGKRRAVRHEPPGSLGKEGSRRRGQKITMVRGASRIWNQQQGSAFPSPYRKGAILRGKNKKGDNKKRRKEKVPGKKGKQTSSQTLKSTSLTGESTRKKIKNQKGSQLKDLGAFLILSSLKELPGRGRPVQGGGGIKAGKRVSTGKRNTPCGLFYKPRQGKS